MSLRVPLRLSIAFATKMPVVLSLMRPGRHLEILISRRKSYFLTVEPARGFTSHVDKDELRDEHAHDPNVHGDSHGLGPNDGEQKEEEHAQDDVIADPACNSRDHQYDCKYLFGHSSCFWIT